MTRPGNVEYPLYELFWVGVIVAPFYFAVVYWYMTLFFVAFGLFIWWLVRAVDSNEDQMEARRQRERDIIERAESQHARLMDGDESALYGDYLPADLNG